MMLEQVCGTKAWFSRHSNFQRAYKCIGALSLASPIATSHGFVRLEKKISLRTTAYLNGVREAASPVVFAEYFLMALDPHMLEQYEGNAHFLQWPGVRLYSGSVSVPLLLFFFFIIIIISGFSPSVQPLRAIHDTDWERLNQIVASATLRRGVRLMLLTAVITFLVTIGVHSRFLRRDMMGQGIGLCKVLCISKQPGANSSTGLSMSRAKACFHRFPT